MGFNDHRRERGTQWRQCVASLLLWRFVGSQALWLCCFTATYSLFGSLLKPRRAPKVTPFPIPRRSQKQQLPFWFVFGNTYLRLFFFPFPLASNVSTPETTRHQHRYFTHLFRPLSYHTCAYILLCTLSLVFIWLFRVLSTFGFVWCWRKWLRIKWGEFSTTFVIRSFVAHRLSLNGEKRRGVETITNKINEKKIVPRFFQLVHRLMLMKVFRRWPNVGIISFFKEGGGI